MMSSPKNTQFNKQYTFKNFLLKVANISRSKEITKNTLIRLQITNTLVLAIGIISLIFTLLFLKLQVAFSILFLITTICCILLGFMMASDGIYYVRYLVIIIPSTTLFIFNGLAYKTIGTISGQAIGMQLLIMLIPYYVFAHKDYTNLIMMTLFNITLIMSNNIALSQFTDSYALDNESAYKINNLFMVVNVILLVSLSLYTKFSFSELIQKTKKSLYKQGIHIKQARVEKEKLIQNRNNHLKKFNSLNSEETKTKNLNEINQVLRGNRSYQEKIDTVNKIIQESINCKHITLFRINNNDQDNITFECLNTRFMDIKKYSKRKINELGTMLEDAIIKKTTITVENVPHSFFEFSTGDIKKRNPPILFIQPLFYQNNVVGIIEVSLEKKLEESQQIFLDSTCSILAIFLIQQVFDNENEKLISQQSIAENKLLNVEKQLLIAKDNLMHIQALIKKERDSFNYKKELLQKKIKNQGNDKIF